MGRTSVVTILEWGTPPEPPPALKGWPLVLHELNRKVGKWANLGEFSHHSARLIRTERAPEAEGYEHRIIPTGETGRVVVWVRKSPGEDS